MDEYKPGNMRFSKALYRAVNEFSDSCCDVLMPSCLCFRSMFCSESYAVLVPGSTALSTCYLRKNGEFCGFVSIFNQKSTFLWGVMLFRWMNIPAPCRRFWENLSGGLAGFLAVLSGRFRRFCVRLSAVLAEDI